MADHDPGEFGEGFWPIAYPTDWSLEDVLAWRAVSSSDYFKHPLP